jgi:uncharacterized protein (TIRG00374 family)
MSRSKIVLTALRVLLGAVLLWVIAHKTTGWSLVKDVLESPAILIAAVALTVVAAYLEALRFAPLVRTQGLPISTGETFRLATAAFSFNFCIPGGASGDLSKVYYLRLAHRERAWELATVVFLDRFIGLLSMLLLMLILAMFSMSELLKSSTLLILLLAAAGLFLCMVVFLTICLSSNTLLRQFLLKAISILPFHRQLERIAGALFHFSGHKGALIGSFGYSFAGNIAGAAMFTMFGRALFAGLDWHVPPLLAMLGMFANTITITPGGLGVGEAAFEKLFIEIGTAGGAAMMILWRICMVPLCVLGLVFYVGGLRIQKKEPAGGLPGIRENGSALL